MIDIRFRAWIDNERYVYSRNYKSLSTFFSVCFSEVRISDETIIEQFAGIVDGNDVEICSGDLRKYKGKIYKVVPDIWRYRLERNLYEFGENDHVTIDEDVAYLSELVGNIHENKKFLM